MTTTDGCSQLRRGGRELVLPTQTLILAFRVELQETDPLVWRTIEVSGTATFWDLHVAIQDAMGWLDYHLHQFCIPHPDTKQAHTFGIHNLSQDCKDTPSWAHQIAAMFTLQNATAHYEYDFGDGWQHTVQLVEVLHRDFTLSYPRCTVAHGPARRRTAVASRASARFLLASRTAPSMTTPASGCHTATTRLTLTRQRCASATQHAD